MNGSQGIRWRCSQLTRPFRGADARPARPLVLAPFSTRLAPELLERLRVAAALLGLHQGEIAAAAALAIFLTEEGF
jgi:hypothetical protein